MNNEDIENLVNTDFNKMEIIINRIYKEDYVRKLEKENKELHNKIDKAIEYIEREFDEYSEFVFGIELKNKILEILKNSDVDE